MKNLTNVLVVALVAVFFLFSSAYTVDQAEFVVVKRLGEIVSVKKSPGLYFKVPFIDDIKRFDNRIVTLDWEQPAKFITSENKYMLVDSFVKWRIIDPAKYYVSVKEGGETAAEDRLSKVVNAGLRTEFGKRTVREVIAGEREVIMKNLRKSADTEARQIGIEVVDVRLKRVDYSEDISKSVYDRMIAERKRLANQCVQKVLLHLRKFVLTPISNVKSLLLKRIVRRKKPKVRAMLKLVRFTISHIAATQSFMRFTVAKKLIKIALRIKVMSWC